MQTLFGFHAGILDPQGPIGSAEREILLNATAIMLAVVVPVIVLTLAFAWWFRAGNQRARYRPEFRYSGAIESIVWSIPALVVLFLGGVGWIGAHDLDPRKPIKSEAHPIDIDVVSLDWKWLFIYPAQGVASVDQLTIPAGTPINFRLTSATVMNSFFIPQLGSQIYTMAGMTTRLNLQADRPGTYPGLSAQFSGDGFSDMRFDVRALPPEGFKSWAEDTHASGGTLDAAAYKQLARQNVAATPALFGNVDPHLFETIVNGQAPPPETPHIGHPSVDISPRWEN